MKFYILLIFGFITAFANGQDTRGVTIISSGAAERGNTYAIVIGISTYKEVTPLQFAHHDAEVFADYLLSKEGMALNPSNVKLFTNEKATLSNIGSALSDLMIKNVKKGDRIIFFFAGHGDYDANILKDQALLLLYGAPKQNYFQNIFSGDFISTADLNARFIDPLAAKGCEVMLIVDACHATGMNKNLSGGAEGGKITSMALQNMTSPIKIYSCQANEYSLESKQWGGGRGLFSYVLMEGLYGMADADNNKIVTLRELGRYLEDHIPTMAAPNKQDPIMKVEDPTQIVATINEAFLAKYKSQKDKSIEFIAKADTKGNLNGQLMLIDSARRHLYLETDNLIEQNKLDKAYLLFLEINKKDKDSDPSLLLRRNLSAALQKKTADLLLPMLKDINNSSYDLSKIEEARNDLEKARDLLGEKHFLYKNLQARNLFLKAYINWLERDYTISIMGSMPERLPGDSIALSWLNESVSLEPNAPYTWYYLGFFNLANGNLELGKAYYKKYLDLMPKSSDAHFQWARVLTLLKDYKEAIIENKKALELSPNNAMALNNLGNIYSVLGQNDVSIKYGLKVIEMDPEYEIGYYNLCCYYSKTGKSEKAIIYLKKSFEKGLDNIKLLATDTDLENIRSIRGFKALLKNYFSSEELAMYPDIFVKASK